MPQLGKFLLSRYILHFIVNYGYFIEIQKVHFNFHLSLEQNDRYEDLHNIRVKAFNGKKVRNLRELAEMVLRNQDSYLRFDLEYDEILVLDVDIVGSATEEVLLLHSIPSIVSKDLEDVIHMVS